MKLTTIHTGNFKLDGGAMFGVVPKVLWNKMNPSDDNNLCNWAMRCLLIEVGSRKILIDTGIGNKQSDKFFSHYYLNGDQSLDKSLAQLGLTKDDITDVILTHLHFDHVGGAVTSDLTPAFSNAIYHVTQIQWNHANNPNPREKASFLPENIFIADPSIFAPVRSVLWFLSDKFNTTNTFLPGESTKLPISYWVVLV